MENYMTTGDVAEMLKKTPETIRRWTRSGKLPVHRQGAHDQLRFLASEIHAAMNGEGSTAASVARQQERMSP